MANNELKERPLVRTPDQLKDLLNKLDESGYKLEQLDELEASAAKREELIRQLKTIDPEINGDAEQLVEDLGLYRQEVEAKKKWSLWEYTKSVPRRIWGTMKRHPYITAAVIIALGAAAAYYTGVGPVVVSKLKGWLMSTAFGQKMAEFGGKASGVVGDMMGKGKDIAANIPGNVPDVVPSVPNVPTPVPVPAPGSLPIPDVQGTGEAGKLLDMFEHL